MDGATSVLVVREVGFQERGGSRKLGIFADYRARMKLFAVAKQLAKGGDDYQKIWE